MMNNYYIRILPNHITLLIKLILKIINNNLQTVLLVGSHCTTKWQKLLGFDLLCSYSLINKLTIKETDMLAK